MNESLLEMLQKVTIYDLILAVLLIALVIGVLFSQKKKIINVLNKWRKKKNDEDEFSSLVYSLKNTVSSLSKTMEQFQKNREHDREDSRRIRQEMYDVMDKQSEGIRNLTDIVVKMQEKNSKTKRAEIKEKIERIYMECHPSRVCTDMAFETLKELIEEYEAHGGDNSFVHTTVEPEMYEWKKIKKIKYKEVSDVENTSKKDS